MGGIRRKRSLEPRHNNGMRVPRFWLAMQALIVIFVLIGMIIAIVKL